MPQLLTLSRSLLLCVLPLMLLGGCSAEPPDPKISEIPPVDESASQKLDVHLFVDATESMAGFTTSSATVTPYQLLIKALEDGVNSLPDPTKKVLKFKFGQVVVPFQGSLHVVAGRDKTFYSGAGQKTLIQNVLQERYIPSGPDSLSVIVTDLFEQDRDTGLLISALSKNYFSKGLSVALIGVTSDFNGIIYDVNNSTAGVPYNNGKRPVYAIVIGRYGNVSHYLEAIKSTNKALQGIGTKYTIFAPQVFKKPVDFFGKGELRDPPDSTGSWDIEKVSDNLKLDGLLGTSICKFILETVAPAKFTTQVQKPELLSKDVAGYDLSQSEVAVQVQGPVQPQGDSSTPTSVLALLPPLKDIEVSTSFREGDKHTLLLDVTTDFRMPNQIQGSYLVQVFFKPKISNYPTKWDAWSTDNAAEEKSKTQELSGFIQKLYSASIETQRPEARLAFYLTKP